MADVTATTPAKPAVSGSRSGEGDDWTVQAADTIESVVGTIRDKTVVPATTVARALVYGLVVAALGAVVIVFLITVAVRLGAAYLPGWFSDRHGRSAWATQAILGGILTLAGLFFLRKANATKD